MAAAGGKAGSSAFKEEEEAEAVADPIAARAGPSISPPAGGEAAATRSTAGALGRNAIWGALAAGVAAILIGALLPAQPIELHLSLDLKAAAAAVIFAIAVVANRQPTASGEGAGSGATREASAAGAAARANFAAPGRASLSGAAPSIAQGATSLDTIDQIEHLASVPDALLRGLIAWRPPGGPSSSEAEVQELVLKHQCPACHDVLLAPRQLSSGYHVCSACLDKLRDAGATTCPRSNDAVDFAATTAPATELVASLSARLGSCCACGCFEGTLDQLRSHLLGCAPARGVLLLRLCNLAMEAERRRLQPAALAARAVEELAADMARASPVLVHRIPPHALESTSSYWSSPPFCVRSRCFSLRMGPLPKSGSGGGAVASGSAITKATGPKYFCLLPHGHEERLRCSIFFAKRPGEGYKERKVHDWPKELAGHPWGPTVRAEELEELRQADGSLLLMVHAGGLGAEGEDSAINGGAGDT